MNAVKDFLARGWDKLALGTLVAALLWVLLGAAFVPKALRDAKVAARKLHSDLQKRLQTEQGIGSVPPSFDYLARLKAGIGWNDAEKRPVWDPPELPFPKVQQSWLAGLEFGPPKAEADLNDGGPKPPPKEDLTVEVKLPVGLPDFELEVEVPEPHDVPKDFEKAQKPEDPVKARLAKSERKVGGTTRLVTVLRFRCRPDWAAGSPAPTFVIPRPDGSKIVFRVVVGPDHTLGAPQQVQAVPSVASVKITWGPPAAGADARIKAFEILRAMGDRPADEDFKAVRTDLPPEARSFEDQAGLDHGVNYNYKVRAVAEDPQAKVPGGTRASPASGPSDNVRLQELVELRSWKVSTRMMTTGGMPNVSVVVHKWFPLEMAFDDHEFQRLRPFGAPPFKQPEDGKIRSTGAIGEKVEITEKGKEGKGKKEKDFSTRFILYDLVPLDEKKTRWKIVYLDPNENLVEEIQEAGK